MTLTEQSDTVRHVFKDVMHGHDIDRTFRQTGIFDGAHNNTNAVPLSGNLGCSRIWLNSQDLPS